MLYQRGLTYEQIANELRSRGINRTVKAVIKKVKRERKKDRSSWYVNIIPSPTERFDKPLEVEEDNVVLFFDMHAPFHDAKWINSVIELALKYDCSLAGIGGDLVDFTALSKYGRQERVELEDEFRSAEQIISALADTFDRVVYCGGNHEMRLPRLTGNALNLLDTMKFFVRRENVLLTDYQWFIIRSAGEKYYVEHPKNFSSHATLVPKALCSKFLCHVIAGHGHRWGITRDASNNFWAIDAGMCADIKRLAYVSKVHSRLPKMSQGAVIIKEGIPILLSPNNIEFYR